MEDPSNPSGGPSNGDVTLPATEVAAGYQNLIEVAPEAASAHLDRVAAVVESCRAARVRFVDAVADLIVSLPPEGVRYPAQVLADLIADDAMIVREKAAETVGELAATLGPAHLSQCEPLFAAVHQHLGSDDNEYVREQAGAACLTLALAHGRVGLPSVALVITFLTQTLPTRAAHALERALERLPTADAPLKPAPTTG